MDPADAAEAIAELAEEHEADKSKERFRNRTALLIAILAALLAICSLGGGNATDDMLFNNIKASDTWAFYQAKNVRQTNYKVAVDALKREAGAIDPASPRGQALAADIAKYEDTVARYESEPDPKAPHDPTAGEGKSQLRAKAETYEKARDVAMEQDSAFDLAEMILQLAIVLGSVAILAMSRPLFWLSAGLGVLGSVFVLNGYFLLFATPF
jgi:uncharacterized protein DUF4337